MDLSKIFILIYCASLCSCNIRKATNNTDITDDIVVFQPNETYASTRIPALVATQKESLLAFCEGRIGTSSDWADMNLIMRRSIDGGKTWTAIHIIDSMKGAPVGNPTPIVDNHGAIHLLYQKDYASAYHIVSNDDGYTWSQPVEITYAFEKFKPEYDWKVIAPGPGHGIQMKNGRLLAAVWLADSEKLAPHRSHYPSCVATIYSDDYGKTWKRGEIIADNSKEIKDPNESMPVLLSDGSVLLSIRNPTDIKRRAFSSSRSGIDNWSKIRYAEDLFDPTCMASIISVESRNKYMLLFVNPDSEHIAKQPRQNLTAKVSFDNGKTWPLKKVLNPGASGYSDLAVDKKGNIYCLYETNTQNNTGFTYSLVMKKISLNRILKILKN